MPETEYNRVVSMIKTLTLSDQLRLLEQMAVMIRNKTSADSSRSIMELKGKGKDIWRNLDVKSYLEEERSSWNG